VLKILYKRGKTSVVCSVGLPTIVILTVLDITARYYNLV